LSFISTPFTPRIIHPKKAPVKLKLIISLLMLVLLMVTCKHELPFPVSGTGGAGSGSNPPAGSTCSPDTVYFVNVILPLISSNCAMSGCHDPATHRSGLVLNNYSGIMSIVRAGNASGSKLYEVISTTNKGDIMPPPPNAALSSSNISLIQKWINQGAKNNQCSGGCDTSTFTYSGAVIPLISTYCKGCHNPASLGGGIDLSSYTGVKTVALDGRLTGSITQATGYKPMPQGGNKLQDCQITQIEKWINAGAQNN
jgi:Planctomycete cytochrome C